MKKFKREFLKGNVIKSPYGRIEIVIEVKDDYISTIPIDSTNTTMGYTRHNEKRKTRCECIYELIDQSLMDACDKCNGTGEVEYEVLGFENATFIASTVKEYIINSLLKNFDIK